MWECHKKLYSCLRIHLGEIHGRDDGEREEELPYHRVVVLLPLKDPLNLSF